MKTRVLFVDDEPNILTAYRRVLRNRYHIDTALGGREGLGAIAHSGPYAVVVSDLRMPGMDGIEFLARVRVRAPETVRVMLTGHADVEAAMAAVNEGNIFRFLTKPVLPDALAAAMEAAVDQHCLITAERELLEETLDGSLKLLTDVLSLVNPAAFSRATRLRRYVEHMVERLGLRKPWQVKLAASLSQIGCITLSPDIIEKLHAGEPLSAAEQKIYAAHPALGGKLVANIPRFENIARIIKRQNEPFARAKSDEPPSERHIADAGAQVLKVALEFEQLIARGASFSGAIGKLRARPEEFDLVIVAALETLGADEDTMEARAVEIAELSTGMIMGQDIRVTNGPLIVAMGQEVTLPVLERLLRLSHAGAIESPVRVFAPRPCAAMPQPPLWEARSRASRR